MKVRWVHPEKRGRDGSNSELGLVESRVAVDESSMTWSRGGYEDRLYADSGSGKEKKQEKGLFQQSHVSVSLYIQKKTLRRLNISPPCLRHFHRTQLWLISYMLARTDLQHP